jgi:hypothetical protein
MRGAKQEAPSFSASRLVSIILSSKHFLRSHGMKFCRCLRWCLRDPVDKWKVSPMLIVALSFAHRCTFNAKLCAHRPSFDLIGTAGGTLQGELARETHAKNF